MTEATIAPVRKALHVRTSPEHAFRTYTERVADWWPVHTHSVGTGLGSSPSTWCSRRERAEEYRADYHGGWDLVLGAFVDHLLG